MNQVMSARRAAILCALLVALGPISLALYTPALPILVDAFGTTSAAMKLTLTAYFVGFAVAQLVCGPLSDAYGRRSVILAFTLIYLIGSAIAFYSPTVEWLLFARVVQGVGGAVGNAVSRAIVRDLYTGQDSAKIMTTIGIMLALGPAISPFIGGMTLQFFGWQEIFLLMLIFGGIVMLATIFGLPETNRFRDPANFRPKRLFGNYAALIRDVRFLRQGLLLGFSLGSIYVIATVVPFVMIDQVGYTPSQFGLMMMIQSGSFITGSAMARWLYRRIDAQALVPVGIASIALAGILFATLSPIFGPSLLTVMLPVGLVGFCNAFIMPAAMTASIAPFPTIAGSASALVAVLQVGGGLVGSALAALFHDPVVGLAVMLPLFAIGAVGSYIGLGMLERRLFPPEARLAVHPGQAAPAMAAPSAAPHQSA